MSYTRSRYRHRYNLTRMHVLAPAIPIFSHTPQSHTFSPIHLISLLRLLLIHPRQCTGVLVDDHEASASQTAPFALGVRN
eukprot:6830876-Pyramimonas_sp.AAC.1